MSKRSMTHRIGLRRNKKEKKKIANNLMVLPTSRAVHSGRELRGALGLCYLVFLCYFHFEMELNSVDAFL